MQKYYANVHDSTSISIRTMLIIAIKSLKFKYNNSNIAMPTTFEKSARHTRAARSFKRLTGIVAEHTNTILQCRLIIMIVYRETQSDNIVVCA